MKDVFNVLDWPYKSMKFDDIMKKIQVSELKKTRIAFLDTGCNSSLEAIRKLEIRELKIDTEQEYEDIVGHGTCFASVLGQYISYEEKVPQITSIKIGNSPQLHIKGMIEGLKICLREKFDVINIGISNCSYNHEVAQLIYEITAMGTIIVAPAGNNISGIYTYPACLDTVLNCGARDKDNQITKFSNRNDKIDCYVPGIDIQANIEQSKIHFFEDCEKGKDGWSLVMGTSFAAAIMTAFVALVKTYDRTVSCVQLKKAFKNSNPLDTDFYEILNKLQTKGDVTKVATTESYYEINHPEDYNIRDKWSVSIYDERGQKVDCSNGVSKIKIQLLKMPFDLEPLEEKEIECNGGDIEFSFDEITNGCFYIKVSSIEGRNMTLSMALKRPEEPRIVLKILEDVIRISVKNIKENIAILYSFDDNIIQIKKDGSLGENTYQYTEELVIKKGEYKVISFVATQNGIFSNMIVKRFGKE